MIVARWARTATQSVTLVIPSEARSLLGLESHFVWLLGVSFACVKFFFLTLFGDSGHVAKYFWVISCGLPRDGHARPTNSTVLLDCAYRENQCSRGQKRSHLLGPKLFVLSLMVKMLLAVACQLVYSWLHSSKTDDIMELLLLLILQHRQKKPLRCHVIYTCNII